MLVVLSKGIVLDKILIVCPKMWFRESLFHRILSECVLYRTSRTLLDSILNGDRKLDKKSESGAQEDL